MIPMRRNPADVWPDDAPPGTFDIAHSGSGNRRLEFICPNGRHCTVMLRPCTLAGINAWEFDDNEDAPTLSPSINCIAEKDGKPTGGCGWHGFIQHGAMR